MDITVQTFMLIMIRIASFIWISPGFSFKGTPQLLKVAISAGLALAVYNTVPVGEAPLAMGIFVLLGIKETLLGAALGYITQLFFSGIEMAGSFVDFQVGFSMSMSFDPMMGVQTSFYGSVYYWIAMAIFFFTNMHHQIIRALVQSFAYIPLGDMELAYLGIEGIVQLFGHVFELASNLAFPLITVALLSEVILALLSRTIPQINVLILGMPLKILLSVLFIYSFLPILFDNIAEVFPEMLKYFKEFIFSLS